MQADQGFVTDQLTMNYSEGPASGPPLLLHGLSGDRRAWDVFFPSLQPEWHLYALDLRGHGESGRVAGRYLLNDYVSDLAAVLSALPEPVVLVGHSLGALGASASWPECVRGLVMFDPPMFNWKLSGEFSPAGRDWFQWVYDTVTQSGSPQEIGARCRIMMAGAPESAILAKTEELSHLDPGTVAVVLRDGLFDGFDLEVILRKVRCPTLLMHGEWSSGGAVRDEDVQLAEANIPHLKVIGMPGAGHLFPWEQQETVLQHLNEFLGALPPALRA